MYGIEKNSINTSSHLLSSSFTSSSMLSPSLSGDSTSTILSSSPISEPSSSPTNIHLLRSNATTATMSVDSALGNLSSEPGGGNGMDLEGFNNLSMWGNASLSEGILSESSVGGGPGGGMGQDIGGEGLFPPVFDTSQFPYPGVITHPPVWEVAIKTTFYALIMALALFGNILVVITVWRNKHMHTTTNYYIVNLAISDLMVTVSCTWVHLVDDLTENWVLGAFFCKFDSFAQVLSLVSSILTLTLISCDRFFGIVFAMKAHMTERRSTASLLIIWILAIGISSPMLVYREQYVRPWLNHTEIWCQDTWPVTYTTDPLTNTSVVAHPHRMVYYTFISVMLYFLPIVVMTLTYSLIIYRLWSSAIPGERIESDIRAQNKMKKKVVIMLVILLTVFALCWLPFQISILFAEHRPNKNVPLPAWYSKFNFFANYIAFANSAINPVIYAGFNENFKRGFKTIMGCRQRRKLYSTMTRDSSMDLRSSSMCCKANKRPRTTIESLDTKVAWQKTIKPPPSMGKSIYS